MNHPCDGRTDRQTDRRNCDSICALSIDAVARKNVEVECLICTRMTFSQSVRRRVIILCYTSLILIDVQVKVHETYYCDLLLSLQLLPWHTLGLWRVHISARHCPGTHDSDDTLVTDLRCGEIFKKYRLIPNFLLSLTVTEL